MMLPWLASRAGSSPQAILTILSVWSLIINLITSSQLTEARQQEQEGNLNRLKRAASFKERNERLNLDEADKNGIYIIGLFDIHQQHPRVPNRCGLINIDAGERNSRRPMQNMEAFLWAIRKINEDKSLLPGVKLGSLVIDTCSSLLRTNQQFARILHNPDRDPALPGTRQIAGVVADNADWASVESVVSMASALGLTTFVTQSRSSKLSEMARKYRQTSTGPVPQGSVHFPTDLGRAADTNQPLVDARLLDDLLGLGIGKPLVGDLLTMVRENGSQVPAEMALQAAANMFETDQPHSLYMIRMLLGNELIADSLASLVRQMGWDLVSVVFDADEMDMVDLNDELAKQLFARNVQLASDEQVSAGQPADQFELLAKRLANKAAIGSRVVITLLGSGSARLLLESLNKLRSDKAYEAKALNSLLWITIADREPYYSFATDALGTITVSNSVSLIPEFKQYYDSLTNGDTAAAGDQNARGASNRWWPEYMKAILARHQRDIELVSNECAKWLEPSRSPIAGRCRSLTLSSLVQAEKANLNRRVENATLSRRILSSPAAGSQQNPANKLQLAKYLAGGWEHNGMDVINSVLSIARGIESVRQALCPESQSGLCDKFRQLLEPSRELPAAAGEQSQPAYDGPLPMPSELLYNELLRSTFQLADGRMFNLLQEQSSANNNAPGAEQLEGALKFYNLRYLHANSIGFVKFGHFDQQDGLRLNATKAKFYPQGDGPRSMKGQEPLDKVKSTCEDESRCFMAAALNNSSSAASEVSTNKQSLSEEELAAGVNSLFKLDHPSIVSSGAEPSKQSAVAAGAPRIPHPPEEESHIYTIKSQLDYFNHHPRFSKGRGEPLEATSGLEKANRRRSFNAIVLLPLHKRGAGENKCSDEMDLEHSFQLMAALAFSQGKLNSREQQQQQQQIELTTTVIDYCDQLELAKSKLSKLLQRQPDGNAPKPAALIDFSGNLSDSIEGVLAGSEHRELLHISIGSNRQHQRHSQFEKAPKKHLRVSLLPSKAREIEALVELISAMPKWKLVHLIYTEHHHYRDEFVRQANKASICVSRLIWIPEPTGSASEASKTKDFFKRVLHDYQSTSTSKDSSGRRDGIGQQEHFNQGLNSTKVLVVLASSEERTNRLILAAATESMLQDYVWLTSHEWMDSVERHIEQEQSGEQTISALPRYLLGTRLETYESYHFKQWLTELTPSIHRPLPTSCFDEFWQQHFSCRLPISSSLASNRTSSLAPCNPNQRIQLGSIREDDKVHYAIQALEALAETLEEDNSPEAIAESYKRNFDNLSKLKGNPGSPLSGLPFGFDIVVRSIQPWGEGWVSGKRRDNSRNLDVSPLSGTLVKAGRWRDGKLALFAPPQTRLDPFGANANQSDTSELGDEAAARESLTILRRLKSLCSTRDSCARSCQLQVDQTLAVIAREESLFEQTEAAFEGPTAISSILGNRANFGSGNISQLESAFIHASFDDDDASEDEHLDSLRAKEPEALQSQPDTQASASSLFDSASRRLVEGRIGSNLRVALQSASASSQISRPIPPPQSLAVILSSVSLFGIVFMILSMTYLYPNMLSKNSQLERNQPDNISCSSFNSFYGGQVANGSTNKLLNKQHQHSYLLSRRRASSGSYYLANLNDYFLFIGLLMVYSINITFLLPAATVSVCWFRRIGLATSYTIIFSSILVKVLRNWRQLLKVERSLLMTTTRSSIMFQQQVSIPDPIEESVEVTFESLSNDQMNVVDESPDLKAAPSESGNQLSNAYQTSVNSAVSSISSATTQYGSSRLGASAGADMNNDSDTGRGRSAKLVANYCKSSTLLTISISLIIFQLLILLVWFLKQPLEPTLHLNCWHCYSPRRSPVLFRSEILLSLIYPGAILMVAWFYSILVFRSSLRIDKRLEPSRNSRQLLLAEFESKQRHLRSLQTDAGSFVTTTSLLVFVLSLLTISMISSSTETSRTLARVHGHHQQQQPQQHSVQEYNSNDISLVYANITSGAIIFAILFLYRSNLFACCSGADRGAAASSYLLSSSPKKNREQLGLTGRPQRASSFSTSSLSSEHNQNSPHTNFSCQLEDIPTIASQRT